MHEAWVRSLGQEDLLQKKVATRSNILAWRIPWKRSLVGTVCGVAVRHDRATNTITIIRGQMCVEKVRKDLHKLLMRQAFLFWINAFIMNMYYLLKITLELFPLKIIVVNMSIVDESCSRERTLNFGLKVLFGVHSTIFSSWVSIWKTP